MAFIQAKVLPRSSAGFLKTRAFETQGQIRFHYLETVCSSQNGQSVGTSNCLLATYFAPCFCPIRSSPPHALTITQSNDFNFLLGSFPGSHGSKPDTHHSHLRQILMFAIMLRFPHSGMHELLQLVITIYRNIKLIVGYIAFFPARHFATYCKASVFSTEKYRTDFHLGQMIREELRAFFADFNIWFYSAFFHATTCSRRNGHISGISKFIDGSYPWHSSMFSLSDIKIKRDSPAFISGIMHSSMVQFGVRHFL